MARTRATMFSRFARLERILASLCVLTPLLLVARDGWTVRGSISAYYDMSLNQWFYVPLTVASMLFICNGVLCEERNYNTVLGAALLGVLMFNHDDWTLLHGFFAGAFFIGNAAVMVVYSPREELRFKFSMVALIAISVTAWLCGYISLFWCEWVSLGLIAAHYILESMGVWT